MSEFRNVNGAAIDIEHVLAMIPMFLLPRNYIAVIFDDRQEITIDCPVPEEALRAFLSGDEHFCAKYESKFQKAG